MRKISGLLSAFVLAFGAAGCGGGDATGTGGGGGGGTCPVNTFCTASSSFSPSARTVLVGTTVTWTNTSEGIPHNVTWDDAAGRAAAQAGDGTGDMDLSAGSHTRLFSAAGVYKFHCTIHFGMNGTLTVQ
jgi:plastocyanin